MIAQNVRVLVRVHNVSRAVESLPSRQRTLAKSIVSRASFLNRSRLSTFVSDAPATPPPPNLEPTRFWVHVSIVLEPDSCNTYLVVCGTISVSSAGFIKSDTHPFSIAFNYYRVLCRWGVWRGRAVKRPFLKRRSISSFVACDFTGKGYQLLY